MNAMGLDNEQKILIVDDELFHREMLEHALYGIAEIYQVSDGKEALHQAELLKPDVILLDIVMPDMDGLEVCRQLKASPATRDSAVIFVTADTDRDLERQALMTGGLDLIRKPLDFENCRIKVENFLHSIDQARQLKLAQQNINAIFRRLPIYVSQWNRDWINQYSNDDAGDWFGLPATNQYGMSVDRIFPKALITLVNQLEADPECMETCINTDFEIAGKKHYVEVQFSKRFYNGSHQGFTVTLFDISSIKKNEIELYRERQLLQTTLAEVSDSVIVTDTDGRIVSMNPAAERLLHTAFDAAKGEYIEDVVRITNRSSNEELRNPVRYALLGHNTPETIGHAAVIAGNGERYAVEQTASPVRAEEGEIIGAILVVRDITQQIDATSQVNYLSNYDQLTGLPNRVLLYDRLSVMIAKADETRVGLALLLLDLDRFQHLNDTCGHLTGDQVIKDLSDRLRALLPPSCTLARIGGDEFAIVVPDIVHLEDVVQLSDRLLAEAKQAIVIDDCEFNLTMSIGIGMYPSEADSQDLLMRRADNALFKAKQSGRDRFCFFSISMEESLHRRNKLLDLLRETIQQDNIEIYYQPKVDFDTGSIVGAEALARLCDGDGNIISPAEFIPLAEESGLILALGKQVLRKACLAAKEWQTATQPVVVSVNVAASQIADCNFIHDVEAVLNDTGLPGALLEIEVTESGLMRDIKRSRRMLNALSDLGISIAIDDFGTGYSSLSYLKQFPVDVLKIDQSFVREMQHCDNDRDIVKTIVVLGQALGLSICPEGIESDQQMRALADMGCRYGQGYLFSKPVKRDDFNDYLFGKVG